MNVVLRRYKCYEKIKQSEGTEKDGKMGRDVDKTWRRHSNRNPNRVRFQGECSRPGNQCKGPGVGGAERGVSRNCKEVGVA